MSKPCGSAAFASLGLGLQVCITASGLLKTWALELELTTLVLGRQAVMAPGPLLMESDVQPFADGVGSLAPSTRLVSSSLCCALTHLLGGLYTLSALSACPPPYTGFSSLQES